MSQRICAEKYDEALFGALHQMQNIFFARLQRWFPLRSLTGHMPC